MPVDKCPSSPVGTLCLAIAVGRRKQERTVEVVRWPECSPRLYFAVGRSKFSLQLVEW